MLSTFPGENGRKISSVNEEKPRNKIQIRSIAELFREEVRCLRVIAELISWNEFPSQRRWKFRLHRSLDLLIFHEKTRKMTYPNGTTNSKWDEERMKRGRLPFLLLRHRVTPKFSRKKHAYVRNVSAKKRDFLLPHFDVAFLFSVRFATPNIFRNYRWVMKAQITLIQYSRVHLRGYFASIALASRVQIGRSKSPVSTSTQKINVLKCHSIAFHLVTLLQISFFFLFLSPLRHAT